MKRFPGGRKAVSLAAALAALLAVSIVSPAVGGPSIGKIAKTAKKALRTAKNAKNTATAANSKADTLLARPALTPGQIVRIVGPLNQIDPATGLGTSIAFCPAGHKVLSGGGANITAAGGLLASETNDAQTAWFVIGEDLGGVGGTTQAEALCAPAGAATIAGAPSRARVRMEVQAVVDRIVNRRK